MKRHVLSLLICSIAVAGCGDFWRDLTGTQSKVGGGQPSGTCTPDAATIRQVILTPPACSQATPCPCGSYCSDDVGGVCLVDCQSDAECASGKTCSPFGQCIGAGTNDGGVPPNPSCPRNLTLLMSAATAARHCDFDDACPFGAYCNPATGLCSFDCTGDTDCASSGSGYVCSCLGKCVPLGSGTSVPTSAQPTLNVTPIQFSLPALSGDPPLTPNWGGSSSRDIKVNFTATSALTGTTLPDVWVTPGLDLAAQCPGQSMNQGPCHFSLGSLTVQPDGTYATATATVTISPVAALASPGDAHWQVRIGASGAAGSPKMVTAYYPPPPPPAPASGAVVHQNVGQLSGPFKGAGSFSYTTPGGQPVQIPIVGTNTQYWALLVYDVSKTISPSGKLTTAPLLGSDFLDFDPKAQANSARGVYISKVENPVLNETVSAAGDVVSVDETFDWSFPMPNGGGDPAYTTAPIHVAIHLDRSSGPAFCSTQSDCLGGLVCDWGLCSYDVAPTWGTPGGPLLTAFTSLGSMFADPWAVSIDFINGDFGQVLCGGGIEPNGGILPFSGDVECGSGLPVTAPQTVVPLVVHRDLEAQGVRPKMSAAQLLAACTSDLLRKDPVPSGGSHEFPRLFGSFGGAGMSSDYLYYLGDCVSIGAWRTSTYLTRTASKLLLSQDPNANDINQPLLQRLLQQWVEVHSFIENEALQEGELADVIGAEASTGPAPNLNQILLEGETGWALLLQEMDKIRNFNASNFDYRHSTDAAVNCSSDAACSSTGRVCDTSTRNCVAPPLSRAPEYEAGAGLPVTLLQGATAHLRLANKVVGNAFAQAFANSTTDHATAALSTGGRAIRFALLAESIAKTMHDYYAGQSGCSDCQDPTYATRWTGALSEIQAARTTLLQTLSGLRVGANPLGLLDTIVPLYFGDPTGTSSQYFAGSDYLIDGWAAPAVSAAQTSLSAARDAWISQQNAVVQDLDAQTSRAHFIDQLEATYTDKILNNCGPLMSHGGSLGESNLLQAVAAGEVDLDTCYIAPMCLGTDDVSNAAVRDTVIKQAFKSADPAAFQLCMFEQLFATARPTAIKVDTSPVSGAATITITSSWHVPSQVTGTGNPAPSFLQPRTDLESGMTDIACFLGENYKAPSECDCDGRGSAIFGQDYQGCNERTDCWTVCEPALCHDGNGTTLPQCVGKCLQGTGTPQFPCQVACTPTDKSGCNYPQSCRFDRDYARRAQIAQLPESQLIPDPTFEQHPWENVSVVPDANGKTLDVITTQARHNLNKPCRIPVDYLYGFMPAAWGYTDLSLSYPEAWQAAYVQCSSGETIETQGTTPFSPSHDISFPFSDSPLPMPELADSCLSGEMGIAQRNIKRAQLSLKASRELLAQKTGHIDDVYRTCLRLKAQAQAEADAAHTSLLQGLEIVGAIAAVAVSVVTMQAEGVALGVGIFAAAVSSGVGAAKTIIDSNLAAMERQFANNNSVQSCWQDYRDSVRGLDSLETDIQQAVNTVNTEKANLAKEKDDNHQAFQDGYAKLQQELGRKYGSYAHSYWFDEKISRFRTEFEWARKLTYLAMQAVEYEFQQSLSYRGDILLATNPDKLEQVILGLKQQQISRTVNGRRPESESIVMSLRDDILKIADNSKVTDTGERNWTAAQRFEGRLWDKGYAYYAKDGTWLGQAVPFDLTPQGILEDRCGERMWRVTATIQGDGLSSVSPNAPLILLKSNTFSSQWCDAGGTPIPGMQSSSVNPSAKLFMPGDTPSAADATQYTPALMTPWFNIRRTDFYSQSYVEGSSQELAGRGLYGHYILLFPEQLLSDGFPLEKVEDVLLRIDYLSVDNLAQ